MSVLELPKQYRVSSIIDSGAILASKSLKDEVIPWISNHKQFNQNQQFKGISFCADNNWKVYKLSSHECIERGTSISDNETFVIFDEYRTRGADIKMDANVAAVLTLSPSTTKDSLMQAAGRLRKLGRNQKIVILLSEEVSSKIAKQSKFNKDMPCLDKVKTILSWSCTNSVEENYKNFVTNAKLAKIHFFNNLKTKGHHV